MENRKYEFTWDLLGDIAEGRPNLGPWTRLELYRLMQFTFRDVMEERLGAEKTDEMFYEAGKLAGIQFYNNVLEKTGDFHQFIGNLQSSLKEMKVGILRVEESDIEKGSFVITVSEDLDCSGLPELNYQICKYDEGFIAALLESFTEKQFRVVEVDCWCTGDRTCRFTADVIE